MASVVPVLRDEAARLAAMTAHDRSVLVEAGAGSGKTAVMAGRLVLLLAGGAAPKAIAAVTFTELAASELLARVRDFIDELLDGHVPRELRIALSDGLSAGQRGNLDQAAAAIDEITCSTIHGFCQRLIKPYPVEADIDPGASLMDAGQADLVFGDTVDRWLRDTLNSGEESLVAELVFRNPTKASELIAIAAGALRDNRVLAAPVTVAIAPLAEAYRAASDAYCAFVTGAKAQEPESIAAATAFVEMGVAVAGAAGDDTPAALVRLLASVPHPSLCTAKGSFSVYKKKGKWEAAAKAAGLAKADGGLLNEQAEALHLTCCQGWTALLQAVAARVLADLITAIQPIADSFRTYKRSTALLDFDDLIFAARDLLRDHPAVRRALATRYAHVLVDEFQDTDPLQTEIFWRLCGDPVDGADPQDWARYRIRPGALFLVGDPKQAIYRFRGADVAAYIRAREAIREQDPDALLSISTNFRSCTAILAYVNERFAPHMTVEKGQPGFTALDSFHPDHGEGLCVAALPVACAGEDGKAKAGAQRDCEAEAVAEMCCRLIGSQIIVDRKTDTRRPCRPGDIALLAPGGTELWRYEEALEKRGVPVATQAGKGFYRRQEIQDLIAITRVMADSRDSLALLALLRGPLVGLTEEQLLDLVWSQPRDPEQPDARPKLTIHLDPQAIENSHAREVIEKLQSLRRGINRTTPYQLLAEAIDVLRVRPILLHRHGGQAERPLANVDLFLSLAQPYGVRGLRAFADAMKAAWEGKTRSVEGRPDAQEEAVSLVTMHASKGLEWPIVVPINTMTAGNDVRDPIIDNDTKTIYLPIFGVAPTGYEDAKAAEVAERERERLRLWYVAATRARELLVLPKLDVPPGKTSWNGLMDFDLDNLPLVEIEQHPPGFETIDGDPENAQTREIFAGEAAAIVAAATRLRWVAPSRDEDSSGPLDIASVPQIVVADNDGPPANEAFSIQGGRERGLVIHKLLEEVLTGETAEDIGALADRAGDLIRDLGREPGSDPASGLSADEMASTVAKTLALPKVAAIRSKLVPELPVYGSAQDDGFELAIFGIVDALAIGDDGKPVLVVDWKSDVNPTPATSDHYRSQVRRYLDVTGIPEGMVVYVTTGDVLTV
ncbi:UvrD-helicase domain-containing protein [Methylobacterium sp. WL19]|uniref:UvrD-helicase domain-containing protein n=1 Tax=Methylobacterium sp. WL19 TaxID=2603896 RepID=UPI0011C86520|nr:UvrD-helicase domain-containing protein [Methylobacterium sp. WL19]TXN27671.1 AAA family ATPase [Methylobacterium sp. WL19]